MLFSEDLLLLLTTDEGKWLADSRAVPLALAGGALAELAHQNRLSLDGEGRLVAADEGTPVPDPTLNRLLGVVRENEGKQPKDVLGTFANGLGDELYERLSEAGVVEIKRGKLLRPSRFPVTDTAPRESARAELIGVLRNEAEPDVRTGTLIGLLSTVGALAKVCPPEKVGVDQKQLEQRGDAIRDGDWSSEAAGRAVRDVQQAMLAAVTTATLATTVATS